MTKILVVEDDNDINQLLYDLLTPMYLVIQAYAGTEARLLLAHESFDLIVLDLMLPGISGEELIAMVRQTSTIPIIVITAKGNVSVLVDVLKLGANDYIAKPFDTKEVMARIDAQLRRQGIVHQTSLLRVGKLQLDDNAHQVYLNEIPMVLTQKEYELMRLFMTYPKRVFTKANLYQTVWQDEYYGDDNTISVHISRLRYKAKEVSEEEIIETVWGVGYKLIC